MSRVARWLSDFAPPPILTVSDWADQNRKLPQKSGARGARWNTSKVPYLRGIMDSVLEPGVRKVAIMKGAQIGGSEAVHNIVGYFMTQDPCAIMFVHPTEGVCEAWSKERLTDILTSTTAISDVLDESKSTLMYKEFANGFLTVGGANTEHTFARWSVRVAIGDDVDRFPPVLGDEGDPADLLVNRTTTFDDPLVVLVSTPTLKKGRIDTLYDRSDQRRYFVTCLCCGYEDWITWSDRKHFHVAFDGRDSSTARIECPSAEHGGCGAVLGEVERRSMVLAGRWLPTTEAKEFGLVGFHLPSTLSTFSSVSLPYLVEKWLDATGKGKESTRVFINTQLAEAWEDKGARVKPDGLMSRRESYAGDGEWTEQPIEIPLAAVAVTAGIDVQDNRFVIQVQAWGPAEERWVVDWRTVDGSPKKPSSWDLLVEALDRKYLHASGLMLPIHAMCIDSGFETDKVYDFVLKHEGVRKIYCTKGESVESKEKKADPLVGKPTERRRGTSRPVRLYMLNPDAGKRDVFGAISVERPVGYTGALPGGMHFPVHDAIDEEYFAQLTAEHRETRYNKNKVATHEVWVKDRERNEALDTAVLCLAALRIWRPNVLQMRESLRASAERLVREKASSEARPSGALPQPPQVPVRRHSPSGYLKR